MIHQVFSMGLNGNYLSERSGRKSRKEVDINVLYIDVIIFPPELVFISVFFFQKLDHRYTANYVMVVSKAEEEQPTAQVHQQAPHLPHLSYLLEQNLVTSGRIGQKTRLKIRRNPKNRKLSFLLTFLSL